MKTLFVLFTAIGACLLSIQTAYAQEPTAFGGGFDLQDFYRAFTLDEITPKNQQKWPYYKHVSANWDKYAGHKTANIGRSTKPAKLTIAKEEERFDLNAKFKGDQTFIDSLLATQTKGFVVIRDNKILAEYYDNGFNVGDTNLLQSASKSFAGVVTNQLVEQGLLDPKAKVETYLKDFKGTGIGAATVQQVLDMTSGLPELLDFHTPGSLGQLLELEQGLQAGKTKGHRNLIKSTSAAKSPGEAWMYSDMNTDTLALLAEHVSGKKYPQLLTELFDAFGANDNGSIALTSDGTTSPAYGISISARDYGLFHQWLAQKKAPKSYYASALDTSKTKFGESETGKKVAQGVTYGSQAYYMTDEDVLYSSGSYGQLGYSDMKTGASVVFLQDWGANIEIEKIFATRDRALHIIKALRTK